MQFRMQSNKTAPPHWFLGVRDFLDAAFPNGQDGYIVWPPRLPDILPIAFFSLCAL